MNDEVDKTPELLSDLLTAEGLVKRVRKALESEPCELGAADASLDQLLSVIGHARTSIAKKAGGIPVLSEARCLDIKKHLFSRYQLTAWLYDHSDEYSPGLIAFEFVNYGYSGSELSGVLEVHEDEEPQLAEDIRAAVRKLADEPTLPLTAGEHPDWRSGNIPVNWKVLLATGSKTDFVLWVDVEITDALGNCTTIRTGHLSGSLARRLQAEWETILNVVLERSPALLPIDHQCALCGSDWEKGEYTNSGQCAECDGFAKERMCRCSPQCNELAIRDSAASHLNGEAKTFPCAHSSATGINWSGDPWCMEALARKLKALN